MLVVGVDEASMCSLSCLIEGKDAPCKDIFSRIENQTWRRSWDGTCREIAKFRLEQFGDIVVSSSNLNSPYKAIEFGDAPFIQGADQVWRKDA